MISVVVATHERSRQLDLCLAGLAGQEGAVEFEVVVADDGSGPGTRSVVEGWRGRVPWPLKFTWEEHRGFRLARSRNRGALAALGEYLIFLDGDCVPPPGFVAAHARARRPGFCLAGRRAFLGREVTERLGAGAAGAAAALASLTASERIRFRSRGLLDRAYRLFRLKDRPKPLGANLAVWRADLLALNGFDERFVGWGYEDEDLGRRLRRRGVKIGFAPAAATVVHLWHPPDTTFRGRAGRSDNAERFRRGEFLARCRRGFVERPLADLRARVRGVPWLEPRFPRCPAAGEPAELEVLATGDGGFDPRSEVRLAIARGTGAPWDFPLAHQVFRLGEGEEGTGAAETVLGWLEERI